MDTANPLARGNRLQRRYYRWALPHYERMGRDDPALRERVELTDIYLYSRQGLPAWAGWGLCLLGGAGLMQRLGMGWWTALALVALVMTGLTVALLAVWLMPPQRLGRTVGGFLGGLLFGFVAMLAGLAVGSWLGGGSLDLGRLFAKLGAAATALVPLVLSFTLLLVGVARAGRAGRERQLARLQLLAERDAAARAAAEADLRLLQAQVQPHFVFNTLAALQHWVDRRDERAGPLLRELTGFLRRSTEMLGRPTVPLAEEVQAVRHYLAILDARLEGRVQGEVAIPGELAAEPVPPGLLLTLVENAVAHGLEPRIGGGRLQVTGGREAGGGWWLRVEDDGLGLADDAQEHVGLANLRQRLAHHFGPRARFALQRRPEGGTRADIHITP